MILVSMILKAKGADVVSVAPDTLLINVLEIMSEKAIGSVLVIDNDRPVGIFSERDFIREAVRNRNLALDQPVNTCMNGQIYCVSPSSTIDECMAIMTNKHIRHLPVMEGGRLAGIISIGDVVKYLIEDKNLLITNLEKYIFGPAHGLQG